jgi:hypothetical protein
MCEGKAWHVVGRAECRRAMAEHDQKIREVAVRSVLGQPQPRKTRTDKARDVLAWVGGIFAASAAGTGALGHR